MSRTHPMTRAMLGTAGGIGLMAMGHATIIGVTSRTGDLTSASPDEVRSAPRSIHAEVRGGGAAPRARRGTGPAAWREPCLLSHHLS